MTEPLGHVEETINRLEAGEARLFSNTPLPNGYFAELTHANFQALSFGVAVRSKSATAMSAVAFISCAHSCELPLLVLQCWVVFLT